MSTLQSMDWTATHLISSASNSAEYRVELRPHGDWSAQWAGPVPMGALRPTRPVVCIDARDELGAMDWPSQEFAMTACAQHARLMADGLGPQEAADRVAAEFRAEELAERALEDSHAQHVDSDSSLGLVRP